MVIATGSSDTVPSDRPRVSATPWYSGVSQASGLEHGRQRREREERP